MGYTCLLLVYLSGILLLVVQVVPLQVVANADVVVAEKAPGGIKPLVVQMFLLFGSRKMYWQKGQKPGLITC